MIRLSQLAASLKHATRGVVVVFRTEQSFRIQAVASVLVVAMGFYFQISQFQFLIVLILIGAVLVLEIVNSIFERIIDSFRPRIHPIVRDIKDVMAGAVLIASLVSAAAGITIFWPHLARLFS